MTVLIALCLLLLGLAHFLSRGMVFQVVFLTCLVMVIANLAGKKQKEKIETLAAQTQSGSMEELK